MSCLGTGLYGVRQGCQVAFHSVAGVALGRRAQEVGEGVFAGRTVSPLQEADEHFSARDRVGRAL